MANKNKRRFIARQLKIEQLESRQLLAANPIITEFMASNGGTLEDGNGGTSDWIEIYNDGDQSVDLLGYGLTDDPADANKWQFPSYTLDAGEFLVVFASGDDTPDLAGNLHTNFALSAGGEYLGLSNPSGTVLSEFGPAGTDYPAQISDESYGLAFNSSSVDAVTPNSAAQHLVPTNSSVDATWMNHSFNDSSWQTGTASVGFERSGSDYASLILTDIESELAPSSTSAYVRIPFTVSSSDQNLDTLQMKYDDGFIAYINGTRVASANAPAVGEYDSTATNEHPDSQAVNYVDFDISAFSGSLNVGANTLSIHMLNRSSGSSDLLAVPNLVLATEGSVVEPVVIGQLASPTPGLPNTNVVASETQFSRVGGAFIGSFSLTMTSSDPSEVIRYTTNGSNPTASSPVYSGPITVSSTTQYRARTYGTSGQVGDITTETYTLTSASTGSFTSDLPIVVLENFGQGIPGSAFEDAALALYDTDSGTGRADLANPADFTSLIGQHRRGSSTFGNPKSNLRIELRDNFGQDQSTSLLGMPSESDWVLYAPYNFDRALMRNTVLYSLSGQAGNYAPRTRFVEVYSNFDDGTLDGSDYMGVYVLVENIKRDSNRVDIDKLTPEQNSAPEITGGYILKLDRSGEPGDSWKTNRNNPTLGDSLLVHVEPSVSDMTTAQRDYIRGYVQDFEDALYGPNSTDPTLGYQAYFDVDASIDHHLFTVMSKDPDGLRLSTYLTKDRDGKLAYGPIWDFDRSMGPDNDGRASNPEGWSLPDVDVFGSDWWGELFSDPNFMQRWVDRWQELRQTVLSDENIEATVFGQAAEIQEAQVRNFQRWPNVAPNGGTYAAPGDTGWEGEVSHLAGWMVARAHWMDAQMISAPQFNPEPGNVAVNTQVALTANPSSNDIYYTLDGSDPRAAGGGVAPSAQLYTGPFTLTETTQFNARTFGTPPVSEGGNSSYPDHESPNHGLDGDSGTKYLNFGGANSGIIVTPNFGSSIVRSFRLTTGNDAAGRDPSSWQLFGTNEAIQSTDNSTGTAENWTLIDEGGVSLPSAREANGPVVTVSNSTSYTSYKLMFPTLKGSDIMQVADIRFYQTTNGTGTQIQSAGDTARAVHLSVGATVDGLSPWSQLVTALYSVEVPADASNLRITELHYHPAIPTAAELLLAPGTSATDYEFIELQNISNSPISLNGVQFIDGVTFDFTTSSIPSIAPGATVLIVENAVAFEARYGSGLPVAGEYSGNLSNGGEQIILVDTNGQTVHDFEYDDKADWPTSPDGEGPSLEVIDTDGDYTTSPNWRASAVDGGTPGAYENESLPGDFDNDNDVDGADFLAWQRGFGSTYDTNDLVTWETNYDTPAIAAALSTPLPLTAEPISFAIVTADSSLTSVAPQTSAAFYVEFASDSQDTQRQVTLVDDAMQSWEMPTEKMASEISLHDVGNGIRVAPQPSHRYRSSQDTQQHDLEVRDAVFEEDLDEGSNLQLEFLMPEETV